MYFCLATQAMEKAGVIFTNETPPCHPPLQVPIKAPSVLWLAAQAGSTTPMRVQANLEDTQKLLEAGTVDQVKAVALDQGLLYTPHLDDHAERLRDQERARMLLNKHGREQMRGELRQGIPQPPAPAAISTASLSLILRPLSFATH
jgi:hypothetical protein